MTLKKLFFLVYLLIAGLLIVLGGISMYQAAQTNRHLKNDIPSAVKSLNESTRLDVVAQLIRYDDEVLTQSARNYAFTGDIKWKDRYDKYVPLLDSRIQEAQEKGDVEDKNLFISVKTANQKLIDLEGKAIALVDAGDRPSAQKILDGAGYSEQKAIFKNAIDRYLTKKGGSTDQATISSTKVVDDVTLQATNFVRFQAWILIGFLLVIISVWSIFYYVFVRRGLSNIYTLKESVDRVAQGDLNQRVIVKSKNEIGQLANSYNQMVDELRESKQNIEDKISARTTDLEKLNKYMTGRELKMIELKKKIEELEKAEKDK